MSPQTASYARFLRYRADSNRQNIPHRKRGAISIASPCFADARIVDVNQKAAQLLGYTREELQTLSIIDIDPLVTPETWELIWNDLVTRGRQFFEREHSSKDGSLMPVEVHGSLLEYENQQYSIAFVQDIAERKQAEEALRQNERLLGNILESMGRNWPPG